MKKYFLIFLCGVAFGCATTDTARRIERECPVKRIGYEDEELLLKAVKQRHGYTHGYVYVTENCWHNSIVIAQWAKAQGLNVRARAGGNHGWVYCPDSLYDVEYQDGIGIVRVKK